MELHPLRSNLNHHLEEEEEYDEEDASRRFHRMDSIDEVNSERISLVSPNGPQDGANLVDNNLDVFFREMYEYYYKKGFGSIIANAFTNLTSILFAICITTFFTTMFNWSKLSECRLDDSVCESFSGYIESPFQNNTLFKTFVLWGFSISSLFWIWLFWGFYFTITGAFKYRKLYRMNDVSTRDLQTMTWSKIVTKLKSFQEKVIYVKNDMEISAFTIALRILRKENYKIALFCMNILPLGSPDWETTFYWIPYIQNKRKKKKDHRIWWMGNMLEINLNLAIFNQIIDYKTFTLRKSFNGDSLRRSLRVLGIVNLIFLPLIFAGTFIHFFFRYAEEFHSKKNYLGPRWWTPHSLWIMREFNELDHVYQRRLNGSLRLGEKYLKMFLSPVPIVLARGAAFILGGLVAILLVLALVDDAVLLHVSLWDRNLVWYAAILSSCLAAARALVPAPEEETPGNPNIQMRKIAAFTHLLPDHWRGKGHTYDVKEEFESLFPFRVALLVRELMCVLATPYILYFVIPSYADAVVDFVKKNTSHYPGVGDVCTFSLLNLEKDGDPKWKKLLKAIPFTSTTASAAVIPDEEKKNNKRMDALIESKLEKSWITFKIQYSADNCGIKDSLGEDLLRRVKDFKQSKLPQQSENGSSAAMLMMSSTMSTDLGQFQLISPEDYEEEEQQEHSEDLFWYLEQFRDEEIRKRAF